ncbi:DUF2480 family protein [Membranicola marinus]|uniref:DUF2480 family protein n=1 Tax=Membranihabitans marinus TaxID=1227546 RepID=A0A953HNP1_9BACT|nr:DUF2480 family protein [Membranihabitans marinus]MBY5957923.1 DUF2480 family protein [Membranihabitans marinus]
MKSTEKKLVNRVAKSPLKTINLEDYFPKEEIIEFDLKDYLFKELILKEKEFRAAMKEIDWTAFSGQSVAITCSTDAIIPVWAFMLTAAYLTPYASEVFSGTAEEFLEEKYRNRLDAIDFSQYENELIVIKGCSKKVVPRSAYVRITNKLRPYARSIMYGEACSTVPIYKKPRKRTS